MAQRNASCVGWQKSHGSHQVHGRTWRYCSASRSIHPQKNRGVIKQTPNSLYRQHAKDRALVPTVTPKVITMKIILTRPYCGTRSTRWYRKMCPVSYLAQIGTDYWQKLEGHFATCPQKIERNYAHHSWPKAVGSDGTREANTTELKESGGEGSTKDGSGQQTMEGD